MTEESEASGVVWRVCVEHVEGPQQRATPHLVRGASCVPGRHHLWGLFLITQPQKNPSVEPSPSWLLLRENSRALNPDLAGSQSQREHQGRPSLSVLKCLKKARFPIIRFYERERQRERGRERERSLATARENKLILSLFKILLINFSSRDFELKKKKELLVAGVEWRGEGATSKVCR